MINACASIIEFQAKAIYFLRRVAISRVFRNAFELDGWKELRSAIQEAEDKVKGYAERRAWVDIRAIRSRIDKLKDDLTSEIKEVLAKHSSDPVTSLLRLLYNNGCDYKEAKNRNLERVKGTCNWFTNHKRFQEWKTPTESKETSLLYVTADPGCGKSVLSRYLIDEELTGTFDNTMVCYFFFKDDFADQKSSLCAISTLLHQLFSSKPSLLTENILERYKALDEKLVESFHEMWDMFLAATAHSKTICVMDALDECHEPDRKQLIGAIAAVHNGLAQTANLKFLLTSRPYDHIYGEFIAALDSKLSPLHLQGDSGPTSNEIATEIELVIKSRVEKIVERFKLWPDQRTLLEKRLSAVPNRTYLWITLVFDGLMERKDRARLSRQDIMDLTTKLPRKAYDAYEGILKNSPSPNDARRILHIILGARRPFSLAEMSVALAHGNSRDEGSFAGEIIPVDDMEPHLRNVCGLFVTVVDGKVYLLQQTAREFLVCDHSALRTAWNKLLSKPNDETSITNLIKNYLAMFSLSCPESYTPFPLESGSS